MNETILITGANGQLGTVLTSALQERFGRERVIVTDIRPPQREFSGRFEQLDVTDAEGLTQMVRENKVTQIYHLAAILSATGEAAPLRTWEINMTALLNVLEAARLEGVDKVFYPSSIAVFGPSAPAADVPNDCHLDPVTVYGISKAAGENWAQYYFNRYGLDVRSLRYPGVIGHQSQPGGGTTDYAVDIYHAAVKNVPFSCFLDKDEQLPMIFMDDAIRATLKIMDAPKVAIRIRTSYNLAGLSFCPADVAASIQRQAPGFTVDYNPDHRQAIAAGWPDSIDDSAARTDWGWEPEFNLERMTEEMLSALKIKQSGQIAA
ncbi:NAD-dependent epimerase/dehydratase family protein [Neolewinella antarctica]|uniref:Nucleoside-diphosphate-sugar epimerase n=1 Tax=Neolewinella antarctica TaxID=442734 RepID=A0ABX0XCG8_9BACT|nr:NAD-dependent epimerase/dehydratase family protein [Neolewinella antarctica]NJC26902.1 nucleoside-diphosphate-sugar epimerase [Neolewinella antarctica]